MGIVISTVETAQEVMTMLAAPHSRVMAGGTTFIDPTEELHLVDISGIEGLDGIRQRGTRVELGALATLEALASSMLIRACAPELAEAAANAGTADSRSRATVGGGIGFAKVGDVVPALLALNAMITIRTDTDFREVNIDRLFPGCEGIALSFDEWITKISFPYKAAENVGAAFGKSGAWTPADAAVPAAAVRITLDGDKKITAVRGGIRPGSGRAARMFPLEKALKNKTACEAVFAEAAAAQARVSCPANAEEVSGMLIDLLRRCVLMCGEGTRL